MSPSQLLDLWRGALDVLVVVGGPLIAVALGVGLLTSLIQAATQLSDATLSFVPKIAAVLVVLALGGSWLLAHLERHVGDSIAHLADIGHSGQGGSGP